jgi:translation initiation factor 3 subunit D
MATSYILINVPMVPSVGFTAWIALITDYVTVNENAAEPPLEVAEGTKDQINTAGQLSSEAAYIINNFAQQAVKESPPERHEFQNPNPFNVDDEDPENLGSRGYRYRKYDLTRSDDAEPLTLIVRTEVDGYMKSSAGEDQFVTIKALNEFDSKSYAAIDWRSKLDSQRGAVVATEMKNNSCKLARWAIQSILADAVFMKIGYFLSDRI